MTGIENLDRWMPLASTQVPAVGNAGLDERGGDRGTVSDTAATCAPVPSLPSDPEPGTSTPRCVDDFAPQKRDPSVWAQAIDADTDSWRNWIAGEDDRIALAWALRDVRARIKDLQLLEAQVGERIVDRADITKRGGCRPFEVPGMGLVKMPRTATRKNWKDDDLCSLILRTARDRPFDPATGEQASPEEAVLGLVKRCASFGWRVTDLTAVFPEDIDPDDNEFCETTKGRPKVVLP